MFAFTATSFLLIMCRSAWAFNISVNVFTNGLLSVQDKYFNSYKRQVHGSWRFSEDDKNSTKCKSRDSSVRLYPLRKIIDFFFDAIYRKYASMSSDVSVRSIDVFLDAIYRKYATMSPDVSVRNIDVFFDAIYRKYASLSPDV